MVIVRMGSLSGVLEDLIADESITEVIANGPGRVFVDREGRLEPAGRSFSGEGEVTIRDLVINSLRMRPDAPARLRALSRRFEVGSSSSQDRGPCEILSPNTEELSIQPADCEYYNQQIAKISTCTLRIRS